MTHMDDQVAKHIKAMIRKIRTNPSESQKEAPKPDTLNRVVHILRRHDYPYDLMPLRRSSWEDELPKT
jgi:hypothetical protein